MQTKRMVYRLVLVGIIITVLSLSGGYFLISRSDASVMELPNAYVNYNLVSLYLQPAFFILFYNQILIIRRARVFIAVRQKTRQMMLWLLALVTVYCILFVWGLLTPYLVFTDYPLFKNGSPVIGLAILLLHLAVLLVLSWLLVAAYRLERPYMLLLVIILLSLVYHYYVEKKILILYSPLYDPAYRAMHRIYGGY